MEFDRLSGINNNAYLPNAKKSIEKKQTHSPDSSIEPLKKNSPVNPEYWQSVAFKGLKKQNPIEQTQKETKKLTPEELEQEGQAYYDKAKLILDNILWRVSDEKKEYYTKRFDSIVHMGKNAMDKYLACIEASIALYHDYRTANFDTLTDDIFEDYSLIENVDMKPVCSIMSNMAGLKEEYLPSAKRFLKFFLSDTTHSIDDKLEWYFNSPRLELYKQSDDENLESMRVFFDYINAAEDDKQKTKLEAMNISQDIMKKAGELFKSKSISASDFIEFSSYMGYRNDEDEQKFLSTISKLHEDAIEKNDSSSTDLFNALLSKDLLLNHPSVSDIHKLISDDNSFERQLILTLHQFGQQSEGSFFGDFGELADTLSSITPDNLDDFKACLQKELEKGSFSMYHFNRDYTNPKTKLFDKKIYDAIVEFDEKNAKRKGSSAFSTNWYWGNKNAEIVKSLIDLQTGEISPLATKFLDKYYFDTNENSKSDKIKTFIKSAGGLKYVPMPLYKSDKNQLESELPELFDAMKDKNGAFNSQNIKYISKIMELPMRAFSFSCSFLNSLKDENGVIEKSKFNFAKSIIEKTRNFATVDDVMAVFQDLGYENASLAYDNAVEIFKSENLAMHNLELFTKYCWGDGKEKVNNMFFVTDLSKLTNGDVNLDDRLFNTIKNKQNKSTVFDYVKKYNLKNTEINLLCGIMDRHKDDNGNFSSFAKQKLEKFLNAQVPIYCFEKLFDSCITDTEHPENNFDNESFDKITVISSTNHDIINEVEVKHLIDIVKGDFVPAKLKFKDKVSLLNAFMKLKQEPEKSGFDIDFINQIINDLDKSIRDESIYIPVNDTDKKEFISKVLTSSKTDTKSYTEFETVMKESVKYLEDLEGGIKTAIPLEKFVGDLSKLCNGDEDKIKILKEKTGISPIINETNGKKEITGYNGILLLDKLNQEDSFERQLYNLIYSFMYENRVITEKPKLNQELNKIIKACPEFINIIGKKQHDTHKHTLDVHSLLVLGYSIDNPDYLKLNPTDKTMLKLSAIFHDIAKQQGKVDEGHQEPSSIYARSIIKKFFNNEDSKDRVYELVRNHHWLVQYNNSSNKAELAKEMAYKFRRPNDFEIAKIMAKADLMAVSPTFYEDHKDALNPENMSLIEKELNNFYATGNALISDYPTNKKALEKHTQTFNGREYKVINFHEIGNNVNMGEYGFNNGKTKKDLNFLVHMVDEGSMETSLKNVDMLTSPVNGGVLSESIISPEYKRTYCERKYGVILSQINANLVNMNTSNQGSGTQKDFNNIIQLVFGNYSANMRGNFKKGLLANLGIDKQAVSNDEFAKFYKENIISKTSYSQFIDSKEYLLGGKVITGKDIKEAIKKFQNSLIDKKELGHNELVGYIPKIQAVIAKEKSLEDVPEQLLNFAYENNLPVVLV